MRTNKETMEKVTRTFDILKKKKELVSMWESVQLVCQAILEKAKADPAAVKASLLREVINSMKGMREIIELAEETDKELKKVEELASSPDGLTAEERRELEECEQEFARIGIPWGSKNEDGSTDPESEHRLKASGQAFKIGEDDTV